MAESKPEQIVEAIRAALGAIESDGGSTAWYTAAKAVRAPGFTAECLDASVCPASGAVHIVIPGEPLALNAAAMGGVHMGTLSVDVAACQRFTPATENPYSADEPLRWTVQNRLARDVEVALYANAALAALVTDVDIPTVDVSADATYIEGWAVAFMRVNVLYQYTEAAP